MLDRWNGFIKDLTCYRYEINGHATDFGRVSKYLTEFVKSHYPINEVPENVADALKKLKVYLKIAEDKYEETIDIIVTEVKKQNFPNQVPPKMFDEE